SLSVSSATSSAVRTRTPPLKATDPEPPVPPPTIRPSSESSSPPSLKFPPLPAGFPSPLPSPSLCEESAPDEGPGSLSPGAFEEPQAKTDPTTSRELKPEYASLRFIECIGRVHPLLLARRGQLRNGNARHLTKVANVLPLSRFRDRDPV